MPRTRFSPDRGLIARMLLTMLLIGLLHAGVVVAVLVLIPWAWWPVAATVAGVLFLAEFWFGARLSVIGTGAREVSFGDAPDLHATLYRLCALIGVPKPEVAALPTRDLRSGRALNAFGACRPVCLILDDRPYWKVETKRR